MERPIIFLDFDHTLFDTAQFSAWLGTGDERESRIAAFTTGTIEPPDLTAMLYPDTHYFLEHARKTHRLILLTYTTNRAFQEKKVRGAGITSALDDVLMTSGEGGGTGKGIAAKEYLLRTRDLGGGHFFVDDAPENIVEVKMENPDIRCIRIDRLSVIGRNSQRQSSPRTRGLSLGTELVPDDIVTGLSELLAIL